MSAIQHTTAQYRLFIKFCHVMASAAQCCRTTVQNSILSYNTDQCRRFVEYHHVISSSSLWSVETNNAKPELRVWIMFNFWSDGKLLSVRVLTTWRSLRSAVEANDYFRLYFYSCCSRLGSFVSAHGSLEVKQICWFGESAYDLRGYATWRNFCCGYGENELAMILKMRRQDSMQKADHQID